MHDKVLSSAVRKKPGTALTTEDCCSGHTHTITIYTHIYKMYTTGSTGRHRGKLGTKRKNPYYKACK